ncbi:MAG: Hsp20/alpha crystallin family protein [Candidatus Latescibacteria bacterium]|nr:Hsp20/alpha crystallin family protein [Candidatus Latescibacterota bacterium]
MALVRWRPLGDFVDVRDEIDRLFDTFLPVKFKAEYPVTAAWAPRVDVAETDNEVIVTTELPGVERKDVKLSVEDNVLTIGGEKKQEKETKEKNYHCVERRYGTFSRSFTLPTRIQADKVKATFKDGILIIKLPKVEEAKTKEIPIEIQSN